MSKKVANKSAVPATIRLVKRAGASIGFSDGVKPAGSVDNAHELTFQLGKFVSDTGRFVIGQRSTPNIKNPTTYASIGDVFKLSTTEDGNFLLNGQWTTVDSNPEYSTLPISIFFSLDSKEAPFVIANPGTTITLQGIAANTQIPKATLLGSMGQYFNDDRLYYPVWSGTVKQLVATWLTSKKLGFPELNTLGPRLVGQDVKVTIEQPIGTVSITGVDELFVGETSQMTYSFTPSETVVKEAIWQSENADIADFDGADGLLNVKGMGSVDITLTLVDSLDNRISTTRTYTVQQRAKPLTLRYAVNSAAVNLTFDSAAPTTGWIDWGDGTIEPLTDAPTHQYHGAQTPTVKVWPDAPVLNASVNGQTDSPLSDVVSWGDATYAQIRVGSAALKSVPTTAPLGLTSGRYMFSTAEIFNQNITGWNVSNVTDMTQMFAGCTTYDQPMDLWNVAKVTEFVGMFQNCKMLNKSINAWVMTKATDLSYMFAGCTSYNQPMDRLRPAGNTAINASYMLQGCTSFNSPIAGFIQTNIKLLTSMLADCILFNQDMSGVSFGNNVDITGMFDGCKAFNGLLGSKWFDKTFAGVSTLFRGCTVFNQPIAKLKTASTNVSYLLASCPAFNQPMNDFEIAGKVNASSLFDGCTNFTSDLAGWDVSDLEEASRMFAGTASFDSELNWWCVSNIPTEPADFATGSFLTSSHYPKWGTCPIRDLTVTIDQIKPFMVEGSIATLTYTTSKPDFEPTTVVWSSSAPGVMAINAQTGDISAVSSGEAVITVLIDGIYKATLNLEVVPVLTPVIFTHDHQPTDIAPVNVRLTPAWGLRRNSDVWVDWGDGKYDRVAYGTDLNHTYNNATAVTMRVSVHPVKTNGASLIIQGTKIYEIVQFGDADMGTYLCTNLVDVPAALHPTMARMTFNGSKLLNSDQIPLWDVSNLSTMQEMFIDCPAFNQDIGNWVTTDVTNMSGMFYLATAFNQDISNWDVSNVTNMDEMFNGAEAFDQDLSWWCVTNIITRPRNFTLRKASGSTPFPVAKEPVWGTCPNRDLTVTINKPYPSVSVGDAGTLTYTLSEPYTPTSVVWSSSAPAVLEVNAGTGFYTAKTAGSAKVTLTIDGRYTATVDYLILPAVAPTIFVATSPVGVPGNVSLTIDTSIDGDRYSDVMIDWGDNTPIEYLEVGLNASHQYPQSDDGQPAKVYRIRVYPVGANGSTVDVGGNVTAVEAFSTVNMRLSNLSELTSVPATLPATISCVQFYACPVINDPNIGLWDTSHLEHMTGMFAYCGAFNVDISQWNVGHITNMDRMLAETWNFKQNLAGWCVSGVTELPSEFCVLVADGGQMIPEYLPTWGTCPNHTYTLDITPVEELMVDATEALSYTLTPEVENPTVVWGVSNPEVATIDASGTLTAVTVGVAEVTLKINNFYTSSIEIEIVEKQVILAPSEIVIEAS